MSIAYAVYIVIIADLGGYGKRVVLRHALALNTLMLVIVGLFLVHKMCILTIWYNGLLDIHPCSPFSASIIARMRKDNISSDNDHHPYSNKEWHFQCPRNSEMWMSSYAWLVALLVVVNIAVVIV